MRPTSTVGRARTPDGGEVLLTVRDGIYTLRVDGRELMSSRAHGSEEALAELTCAAIRRRRAPRVLVGGLGMGYTLRAALDRLAADAWVCVAELMVAVVAWNRGPLAELARRPLDDRRVHAAAIDVVDALEGAASRGGLLDAVLLDVDNGPEPLTLPANRRLYDTQGVDLVRRALRPGGVLGLWSADPEPRYERRLSRSGFRVEVHRRRARGAGSGPQHVIYLAQRR